MHCETLKALSPLLRLIFGLNIVLVSAGLLSKPKSRQFCKSMQNDDFAFDLQRHFRRGNCSPDEIFAANETMQGWKSASLILLHAWPLWMLLYDENVFGNIMIPLDQRIRSWFSNAKCRKTIQIIFWMTFTEWIPDIRRSDKTDDTSPAETPLIWKGEVGGFVIYDEDDEET